MNDEFVEAVTGDGVTESGHLFGAAAGPVHAGAAKECFELFGGAFDDTAADRQERLAHLELAHAFGSACEVDGGACEVGRVERFGGNGLGQFAGNRSCVPLIESQVALFEPAVTGRGILALELLGGVDEMAPGVVPVDQCLAVREVERCLLPNPEHTVAKHQLFAGLFQLPTLRLTHEKLTDGVGSSQMCDAAGVDRLSQRRLFSGQGVCTPAHTQAKDASNLEFLPAFVPEVDSGAIKSDPMRFAAWRTIAGSQRWGCAVDCVRCRS